jgi:hypothetical protein
MLHNYVLNILTNDSKSKRCGKLGEGLNDMKMSSKQHNQCTTHCCLVHTLEGSKFLSSSGGCCGVLNKIRK